MAGVTLTNLIKRYGSVEAVRGISLDIPDGHFVAFVGPSGCGKTTTLRRIAGLEDISEGEIAIGGRVVNEVPPKDRDIAMVFQSYALYPHMTVYGNMSFGLRLRGTSKADVRERVRRAAEILHIEDLLDRRPRQLSGGQRQRVAMGRAIVRNPEVFLFDEPLSNLDAKLRVHMRTEIKRVHQRVKTTTVYVTHDQVEAMTLADMVVVMNKGLIEQVGAPQILYHEPRTRFVASFMGSPAMNLVPCLLEAAGEVLVLKLEDGSSLPVPASRTDRYGPHVGKELLFGIRPEHLSGLNDRSANQGPGFTATIDVVEPMGMETMVFFRLAGVEMCARLAPDSGVEVGKPMRLKADLAHMHLISPETDLVI